MMKTNKTNLAFGTLLCTATLSSMLMTHSRVVHADADNSNTQGAAAMQFDEDVQTESVSQIKNIAGRSAQAQTVGTVERERAKIN